MKKIRKVIIKLTLSHEAVFRNQLITFACNLYQAEISECTGLCCNILLTNCNRCDIVFVNLIYQDV